MGQCLQPIIAAMWATLQLRFVFFTLPHHHRINHTLMYFNLLAPELFFFKFYHTLWIIQEPNTLEL
jgi:hypothetical protein